MKKKLTMVVSLLLVMALSIGGTLAYLTYTTETVTNTFTIGNVKIELFETKDGTPDGEKTTTGLTGLKMVPGNDITKNPTIKVDADSENCWIFVKVEGNESYDDYLKHTMATGWTAVEGEDGVYVYAKDGNNSIAAGTTIQVLANNKVTVKDEVTQDMMDDITDGDVDAPELSFTAYAVQFANVADVEAAWDALNPATEG